MDERIGHDLVSHLLDLEEWVHGDAEVAGTDICWLSRTKLQLGHLCWTWRRGDPSTCRWHRWSSWLELAAHALLSIFPDRQMLLSDTSMESVKSLYKCDPIIDMNISYIMISKSTGALAMEFKIWPYMIIDSLKLFKKYMHDAVSTDTLLYTTTSSYIDSPVAYLRVGLYSSPWRYNLIKLIEASWIWWLYSQTKSISMRNRGRLILTCYRIYHVLSSMRADYRIYGSSIPHAYAVILVRQVYPYINIRYLHSFVYRFKGNITMIMIALPIEMIDLSLSGSISYHINHYKSDYISILIVNWIVISISSIKTNQSTVANEAVEMMQI